MWQEPMVRHEAGEALGAVGAAESLAVLEEFENDPRPEVPPPIIKTNRNESSAKGSCPFL